jgi:4-hydroxybenzoate polyprenyltransferase
MQKLGAFLSLVRWYNLIMVALTQYLFRYFIIRPVFYARGYELPLSSFDFFLLVLATMLVSAAGYAINDYFDLRIDRINKPDRVIVGRLLSRRSAILAHWILNTLGVLLGVYLSWQIRYWPLALIFMAVPFILWLYSIRFKRSFLTGNITVAVLSAMVVALVWLVEYRAALLQFEVPNELLQVGFYARLYAFFAFITTLIREVVKDMEDYNGDKKTGCRSLAVVAGLETSRKVGMSLMILMLLLIGVYLYSLAVIGSIVLLAYFLFVIIVPLLLALLHLSKALGFFDFGVIQRVLKLIMLAGVLSMIIQYFYIGG